MIKLDQFYKNVFNFYIITIEYSYDNDLLFILALCCVCTFYCSLELECRLDSYKENVSRLLFFKMFLVKRTTKNVVEMTA